MLTIIMIFCLLTFIRGLNLVRPSQPFTVSLLTRTIQSYGIFQAYYQTTMLRDSTGSDLAWIGSVQVFANFFCVLVSNPLVSRGYFRHCFHGASFTLFIGILSTSWCTTYPQLLGVQGALIGVSMGVIFASGFILVSTYFSSKTGLALAICATGASFGIFF